MAAVIGHTGPLIALARIDSLFIPRILFSRIRIPETVGRECRQKSGKDSRRIEEAVQDGWISIVRVNLERADLPLSSSLGRGETEAIQLAVETPQSLLILDDRLARRQALRRGLAFIGTVRLLWLAEQRRVIDDAEAIVQRMTADGYRISPRILQQLKAR